MGNNSSSSERQKTKLVDYENIPDVYKIVDPKGGGELVDLALLAYQTKDMSRVDDYIKQEVSKYLLNNGNGELVRNFYTLEPNHFYYYYNNFYMRLDPG